MTSDEAMAFDAEIPPTSLHLPASAHVPGTGTEPDWPPLEAAKAAAATITSGENWRNNQAYNYGFALLRAGFYWEAHEVWEPVWLASPPNSLERSLLRALIQTANAKLKRRMGRPRAASRLVAQAQQDLADFGAAKGDAFMGVAVAELLAELKGYAAELPGEQQ